MGDPLKTSVLLLKLKSEGAMRMVEMKKTSQFGIALGRPKKSQIHIHSVSLIYEPILMVSGSYSADYYRKAVHPIKVDANVKEVVVGPDVFPVRKKSKLSKLVSTSAKRTVDLGVEEHVFVKTAGTLYLDHHGKRLNSMPYRTDSKNLESYGSRVIAKEKTREHEIEVDDALIMLKRLLKNTPKNKTRAMDERFEPGSLLMLYVPVYEARLVGPSKKIRIMRIDAVRKKIL